MRERSEAHAQLAALGKASKDCPWQELEHRADLAYQAASPRKALEYLRRAKNACPDPEQKTRLTVRVSEWTQNAPVPLKRKYWRVTLLVEQLEEHYGFEQLPLLSWAERQKALAQPALASKDTQPVACFNGFRLEPLQGPSNEDTWAWRESDGTLRHWKTSGAKVTIDPDTGVLLWLPGSGASGRTGFSEKNGTVYGPEGPLPWLA